MKESDAYTIANIISSKELMKKAGIACFEVIKEWKEPVAIVCGTGNNAGDGYVIANLLKEKNIDVTILLVKDKFSKDGKYYYDICLKNDIKSEIITENTNFNKYQTIVDCIFGTGFKGEVKDPFKKIIEMINQSNAYKIAIDINSGLNGDNGLDDTYVKSDLTISIGYYKSGHFLNKAKDAMKEKANVDIGIKLLKEEYKLIEEKDLYALFKERKNFSNKADYGYITLVGGSLEYSGAIRLAAMANSSMRSGAGVVTVATVRSISNLIAQNTLECTVFPLSENNGELLFKEEEFLKLVNRYKVIAIGMGIGNTSDTLKAITYLIQNYQGILIIDADGLNALAKIDKDIIKNSKAKLILTPHMKEMSRILNCEVKDVVSNSINLIKKASEELNAIILLKGPTTIISDNKSTYLVDKGCSGMATAGSGDVLSGILAACVAANEDNLLLATAAAAYINGKAGELAQIENGSIAMCASDTANKVKEVVKILSK